ncbi:MAG: hypothetical protein CL878_09275 [Dehalococcoidia bacterium]|nr:hypothetical protein [Dehalococcoidia bacterium]
MDAGGGGRGRSVPSGVARGDCHRSPPPHATWGPRFGRPLGGPARVIGHCDVAPWNIVAHNGLPVALIDWDFAGPVDPVVELAQAR